MHRHSPLAALAVTVGSTLLLTACGEGGGMPGMGGMGGMEGVTEMMRMMGRRSMELPEGIPAGELPDPDSRDARLVAAYCSQCHGIPSPRRHTAEDWGATARRMFRRMAHMEHMGGMMGRGMMGRRRGRGMMDVDAPSAAEEGEILAYLREHAMRGTSEEALPVAEGRETFARACSRCHALPDPAQHAPEEWTAVVDRMRENMARMEVDGISDAEAERIVRYLRRAAAEGRR